eukprot:361911-Rhodomonas_salina.1
MVRKQELRRSLENESCERKRAGCGSSSSDSSVGACSLQDGRRWKKSPKMDPRWDLKESPRSPSATELRRRMPIHA